MKGSLWVSTAQESQSGECGKCLPSGRTDGTAGEEKKKKLCVGYIKSGSSHDKGHLSFFPPPPPKTWSESSAPRPAFVSHCFPCYLIHSPTCAYTVYSETKIAIPESYHHIMHQMEVDYDSATAPSTGTPVPKHEFIDQELIPKTSRLTRLPSKVPLSPKTTPSNPDKVAIPAFQNTNDKYSSQDVHLLVNSSASSTSSTATRSFGQPSTPLETSVSSFSQPLSNHVLTHPIRRPSRTSNQVFQSSTDLAAHYGIPQRLPPAPRTTTRYLQPPAPQPSSPLPDFQTLSANYLNMLSNKTTDTPVAASSTPAMSSTELTAPVIPTDFTADQIKQMAELIGKTTASTPRVFAMTHRHRLLCSS